MSLFANNRKEQVKKVKCIVCGTALEEGRQYVGHMIIQHEYPFSWLQRQLDAKRLQNKALRYEQTIDKKGASKEQLGGSARGS